MGFWPVVKRVIKDSDIVLFILDARMPELSQNSEIIRMAKYHTKKVVYVFNKIDLIGQGRTNVLKKKYPGAFFVASRKNEGISTLRTGLKILAKKMRVEEPQVGVVGYPNVGKSSVINALARGARAKTGSKAGVTRGIQWINAGGLKVLDSPGAIPFEDASKKLGLLGAKDPEKMKVPEKVADELIRMFLDNGKKGLLEKFYNMELSDDSYEIMLEVGEKRGFLMRKGEVDERKVAIQIVRDWQKGKLKF